MIKEKTEKENWQFVFLSADLAAIGDAQTVGFAPSASLLYHASLLYQKSKLGSAGAWTSLSRRTSEYRLAVCQRLMFLDEDRQHPDDPNKGKEES